MNEIFITVIIYADQDDTLENCLTSIVDVPEDIAKITKIIVVDPICSEISVAICERMETECGAGCFRYIRLPGSSIGDAYNAAIPEIRGRYVNFSMSSILFQPNALEDVYKWAVELGRPKLISLAPWTTNEKGEEVPYKISPISKDPIYEKINLEEEPARLQLFLAAYFIRGYIVTDSNRRMSFKPELREDAPVEFLLNILKEYQRYVFLPNVRLYYNYQLEDNTSAFFGQHNLWWYNDSFKNWILPFEKQCMGEKWKLNRAVQIALLWLIASRFLCNYNDRNKGVLSGEILDEFLGLAGDALWNIDNELIYEKGAGQTFSIPRSLSIYLIKLKARCAGHQYEIILYQGQGYLWNHPAKIDPEMSASLSVPNRFNRTERLQRKGREPETEESLYVLDRAAGQFPVLHDVYTDQGFQKISSFQDENVALKAINYKAGMFEIDGTCSLGDFVENDRVCLKVILNGQEEIPAPFTEVYGLEKIFGRVYNHMYQFHVNVPIRSFEERMDIQFGVEINGRTYTVEIRTPKGYSHVRAGIHGQYWRFCANGILSIQGKKTMSVTWHNETEITDKETAYQKSLLNLIAQGNEAAQRALEIRKQYYIEREKHPDSHIWITYDKIYKAGDNGEYIYNYISKQNDGIEIYYIIKKDSLDYERLRNAGANLLIFGEIETLVKVLLAEAILVTHSNTFSYVGFENAEVPYICDLYNAMNVCIQHGLTVQNIAQYQNRVFDDLHLYTLASPKEFENLCRPIYGFEDRSMLRMTGLARFDGLKNDDKRQILITPSWRRNIVNAGIAHIKKEHNDYFKNSEFYRIYNDLINDEQLIDCARKNQYRIIFLLHPAISSQADDFVKNDYVEIVPATSDMNYEKILTESSLMVTDYSGIQFDFAYMRKPILYFHPENLPSHYDESEAYIYERDAFGPIIDKYTDLVEEICRYMESQCKAKNEYIERADRFFEFHDYDNCQRIYQEVIKALNERRKICS